MKRYLICILAICLLVSGCSWMDGNYVSVTPHRQQSSESESTLVNVENYLQLRTALEDMIRSGMERCVISADTLREDQLKSSMAIAVRYVKSIFPIGAYAVEDIEYELGTSGGVTAVAVEVTYLHTRSEIQKIRQVEDMEHAKNYIRDALTNYETGLVMLVNEYITIDLQQMAEDFAAEYPSAVMETPEIREQTYPNTGTQRVLELKFTYQSSRDTLRTMQEQVQRVFDSAALYVSRDAEDSQKYAQLYAFLMERFSEYQIKTSITPAYSLLNHGVGDSKAFAVVFAQMCREAGLECQSVVGTRDGEPWFWNIVYSGGYYYHVDLLACQAGGGYREHTDNQMVNYVWDYSAYPVCTGQPPEPPVEETTGEEDTQEADAPTGPAVETTAPTEAEEATEISE